MVLARLGLRSAEVARLELGDVDWRAGEIAVRGKERRADRLPLPVEAGEALAAYLVDSRPPDDARQLFLTIRAPRRPIRPDLCSDVVRRACRRAGLAPVGAHRLRHALATELLGKGADLVEISQVLRHRDLATTAVYAKVDLGSRSTGRFSVVGRAAMSPLAQVAQEYLALRSALGHDLADAARLLPRFVAHLEATGAQTVTIEAALAWAQEPDASPASTVAFRLGFSPGINSLKIRQLPVVPKPVLSSLSIVVTGELLFCICCLFRQLNELVPVEIARRLSLTLTSPVSPFPIRRA
jgi:hypothetical protein